MWSVYDDCGNSNVCSQVVTITDTTPPMIACPTNIQVVSLNSNCQLVIPSISVTASDTCTPYCSLVFAQNPTNGTIVSGDSATVTVTVTDLCGNSNSCEVLVEGVPKQGIKVVWPTNLVASNCVVPCAADFVHVTDCYCPESSLKITQSPLCGSPAGYGVNSVSVTVSDCNGMIAMKVLPLSVPGEESFMNVLTNTGVGVNGALLSQNAIDPHYVINGVPTPAPPGYDYPYPVAVLNLWPTLGSSASTWIAPTTWLPLNRDLDDSAAGDYLYSYTFTLPSGVDPATASITGRWAADDGAILMTFNGWVTGNTITTANGYHTWTPFSIETNFVRSQNQITFYTVNAAGAPVNYNPTGLRVEFLSANVCGNCAPPYVISVSPSQTLQAGSLATFKAQAGGTGPFSYQWEFNNAPIAGATDSTVHVNPVTYSSGGLYSIIISNPCGVITGYTRLTVTQPLPWPNANWNIADVDNPLSANFGPDLFVTGTNYDTTLGIGAGTTEDFGLPDPGDQIVNVMSINPQAGTVIGMPPIVAPGSNSDNSYTIIMDVYEPDTSLGSPATLFESYVTNLTSGGQDGVGLTLDASNYVHITVTAAGTPHDYPSATPLPVDSWNRVALVGEGPQADGTGANLSFYPNGISQVAIAPCMCCTNWFYGVAWTNNTTTTVISSTNTTLANAVLYISDIQFHGIAMTPQMIAGIGSPASGSAPATLTEAGPSPMLSATMSNGVVNITWAGSPYVLQETSDLSSGVWAASVLPFTETTVNGNVMTTATVTPSTNAPSKFYRQAFSP
jgi:hypothetical protein